MALRGFTVGGTYQQQYFNAESSVKWMPRPDVRRTGRWLGTTPYVKGLPTDNAQWSNPRTFPVAQGAAIPVQLQKFLTTADRQRPYSDDSLYLKRKVDETAGPVQLLVQLRRFVTGSDVDYPTPPEASLWKSVMRPDVRRTGRWVTAQPYQPSFVPESFFIPSKIVLIPTGPLAENLRRFVTGQDRQPPMGEASFVRTRKIDVAAASVDKVELHHFITGADRQPSWTEASWWTRRQFEANTDLYGVRRAFFTHAPYIPIRTTDISTWRRIIDPLIQQPMELRHFTITPDRQPVQRPESLWWSRQITIPLVMPNELRKFLTVSDRQRPWDPLSLWLRGPQIPPLPPAMPLELRRFLIVADRQPVQRGEPVTLHGPQIPNLIEYPQLRKFLIGADRQPLIIPLSMFFTRKLDEKPLSPVEIQRFLTTPAAPYQWGYLIVRGDFVHFVVPDVFHDVKYQAGYTIITKKTRLN